MSLLAPTAWGLLRAIAVTAGALALGWQLGREISAARRGVRKIAWGLLLAPLCTPTLVVSYAYSSWALAALPAAKELGYAIVLALRLAPFAAIAHLFFSAPLSPEGRYCHALAAPGRRWRRAIFAIRAAGATPWIAGGLIFLLAFAEFELASLWSLPTWTVTLFDAHTGGLPLSDSLRLAAAPLACQAAVLALVLLGAGKARTADVSAEARSGKGSAVLFSLLTFLSITTCAYPLARLIVPAMRSVASSTIPALFWQDFAASAGLGLIAASIAWAAAPRERRWILPAITPGLLGALVVSLLVLALFQQRPLRAIYDTPLPLLLALVLLLLPPASLLHHLLAKRRPTEALHLARMLGHRRLLWQLDRQRQVAAFFALFGWAYFEFTASSILAPVGMTPVFVRLHNLAHYGQQTALSAMLLAAFVAPLLGAALTVGVARLYARRNAR